MGPNDKTPEHGGRLPEKPDLEALESECTALRKELSEISALKEDVMATGVFKKAKKLMAFYITAGGITLTLAGVLGFKWVVESTRQLVAHKVNEISEEEVRDAFTEEVKHRIDVMLKDMETTFTNLVNQQLKVLAAANDPVGRTLESVSAMPSREASEYTDYATSMGPVRDQRNEGSSVAFAVAAALEFQILKKTDTQVTISPRYLYFYARDRRGVSDRDAGAFIRDAVDVILTRGGVEEKVWQYTPGEYAKQPPENVETAKHYKIKARYQIQSLGEAIETLRRYGPFPGGFSMYKSITGVTDNGIVPMPTTDERMMGSHAVCFVGFDNSKKLLKFRNCWGDEWGEKGYGYLPYEYIQKLHLLDAWAISM